MIDRTKFLGSSDAAPAIGLSKWKSPVQLWLEKTGTVPPMEDNIVLELGRFLEPFVLQKFEEYMDAPVGHRQQELVDPKRPWRVAHIDGRVDSLNLVEAKTAGMVFLSSNHGWGEPGTDEIPDQYLIQCQHSLSLDPEAEICWVPVLLRGVFAVYKIPRNQEIIDALIEKEERFWDLVESGKMPDPQTVEDMKALFPNSTDEAVEATPEVISALRTLRTIKGYKESQKEIEEQAKMMIFSHMKDKSILVDMEGNTLATWKTQRKKSYVVKESQSRVFRPKFDDQEV